MAQTIIITIYKSLFLSPKNSLAMPLFMPSEMLTCNCLDVKEIQVG